MGACFSAFLDPCHSLEPHYTGIKLLGKGTEATVWLCENNQTKEQLAVKLVPRGLPKHQLNLLTRELQVQAALGTGHVNIVRPREILLTRDYLCLVTE